MKSGAYLTTKKLPPHVQHKKVGAKPMLIILRVLFSEEKKTIVKLFKILCESTCVLFHPYVTFVNVACKAAMYVCTPYAAKRIDTW